MSLQEARLRVKDATIWRGRVGLILVVGASVVCRTDSFRDAFASPRETLRAGGHRLSRSWSPRDLSAIAPRGDPGSPRARRAASLRSGRSLNSMNSLIHVRSESWHPGGASEA